MPQRFWRTVRHVFADGSTPQVRSRRQRSGLCHGSLRDSEWLGLSKLLPGAASAAKAVYDRVVGKSPRLSGGIELRVFNTTGWRRRQRATDRLRARYRIYFIQQGNSVVILLCGGDTRTQNKDIRTAKRMAKEV